MRWFMQVFSLELRKVVAYRVDFWFQFIMSIFANVATAYYLWKAIFAYRGITEIGGYSFTALMFYYLLVPMTARMINGPGLGFIAQEIYDGSLNRYLIYPVSFIQYKYAQYLADTAVYFSQFLLGIVAFHLVVGIPSESAVTVQSLAMGIGAILAAGIMSFTLSVLLEMTAFWADNVWSLLVMVRFAVGLAGGALIPLSLFPDAARSVLSVLPFSYLASFPIEVFTGRLSVAAWGMGLLIIFGWTLLFSLLSMIIWNRGKYRYTGVGI